MHWTIKITINLKQSKSWGFSEKKFGFSFGLSYGFHCASFLERNSLNRFKLQILIWKWVSFHSLETHEIKREDANFSEGFLMISERKIFFFSLSSISKQLWAWNYYESSMISSWVSKCHLLSNKTVSIATAFVNRIFRKGFPLNRESSSLSWFVEVRISHKNCQNLCMFLSITLIQNNQKRRVSWETTS